MASGPFPIRLVCPRCRVPGSDGTLSVRYLEVYQEAGAKQVDVCRACGTAYPRIDGIRCVPPDLRGFLEAQGRIADPEWLPASNEMNAAAARCVAAAELDTDSGEFFETSLPAQYALAHFPEALPDTPLNRELLANRYLLSILDGWLRAHRPSQETPARCALDVGCGPGRLLYVLAPHARDGAVGMDLRLSMLRAAERLLAAGAVTLPFRTEGRRFEPVRIIRGISASAPVHLVQGDVIYPPFEAEIFPIVSAVSLLDTIPDPVFALGQLDALVAFGGLLIVATPYHWEGSVTPPENWWSRAGATGADTVRLAIAGRHPLLPHLSYEILAESANVPWSLPGHGRLVHRFFLDVLMARKKRERRE